MNLTNIEEMQYRLNELMELPKDKFPSVLKLVEDLENLYKENKQQEEVIQTYETLLKTNIEENKQLKKKLQQKEDIVKKAKEKIDKANKKIEKMFDDGDENKVIDDLIEIQKILDIDKGE